MKGINRIGFLILSLIFAIFTIITLIQLVYYQNFVRSSLYAFILLILVGFVLSYFKIINKEVIIYIQENSKLEHYSYKKFSMSIVLEKLYRSGFVNWPEGESEDKNDFCILTGKIEGNISCYIGFISEKRILNGGDIFSQNEIIDGYNNIIYNGMLAQKKGIGMHIFCLEEVTTDINTYNFLITERFLHEVGGFIVIYDKKNNIFLFPDAIEKIDWPRNSPVPKLYKFFIKIFEEYL